MHVKQKFLHARCPSYHPTNSTKALNQIIQSCISVQKYKFSKASVFYTPRGVLPPHFNKQKTLWIYGTSGPGLYPTHINHHPTESEAQVHYCITQNLFTAHTFIMCSKTANSVLNVSKQHIVTIFVTTFLSVARFGSRLRISSRSSLIRSFLSRSRLLRERFIIVVLHNCTWAISNQITM